MRTVFQVSLLLALLVAAGSCVEGAPLPEESDADDAVALGSTSQAIQTTSVCGNAAGLQSGAAWPMRGGCSTHATQSSEFGPVAATLNWSANLSASVQGGAAISADGSIFIGAGTQLDKITPATGAVDKSLSLGGAVRGTPAIGADGTVYAGSDAKRLVAVDPVGFTAKWTYITQGAVSSSPAIDGAGVVYVTSADGVLHAVKSDGTAKWTYKSGSSSTAAVIGSPAITREGNVIFCAGTAVYAIGADGALKWKTDLGASVAEATPVIGRLGTVYIPVSTSLAFLDSATGQAKSTPVRFLSCSAYTPAVGFNGTLYVPISCPGGGGVVKTGLYALDDIEGGFRWSAITDLSVRTTPIVDRVGNVYFGSDDDYVYAYNHEGDQLWKYRTGGDVQSPVALGRGGAVIVGAGDNKLYSIGKGKALGGKGAACDADNDCAPEYVCGNLNSDRFDKPGTSACVIARCLNGIQDPGETETDCGGSCGSCTNVCTTACKLGDDVLPAAQAVLSFQAGVFVRSSAATYRTGSNRLEAVGSDRLRYEYLGDANGRFALFEGYRVNKLSFSEQLDHTPDWSCANAQGTLVACTSSVKADAAVAPNGTTTADRVIATSGTAIPLLPRQQVTAPLDAGVLSAWTKLDPAASNPSSPKTRVVVSDSAKHWYMDTVPWVLTSDWTRPSRKTSATSQNVNFVISQIKGWPGSATTFPDLGNVTYFAWGWQFEEGPFASSYIPSDDNTSSRDRERLIFEPALVPSWMKTGVWQFDVMPIFASGDVTKDMDFVLIAWEGGSISLATRSSVSSLQVQVGNQVSINKLLWTVNERGTITIDIPNRLVHVRGWAGSIDPDPMTLPSGDVAQGQLSIGSALDGSNAAFARISEPRRVPSEVVKCVPDQDCHVCGDGFVNGTETCDSGANWRCKDCKTIGDPIRCDATGLCGPGQECGRDNGGSFGLEPGADVCWPAIGCGQLSSAQCDALTAACGFCPSVPHCEGKKCGDDPSDGNGGLCFGFCGFGDVGCNADTDCSPGQVCGFGEGYRFGHAAGSNVCWDPICVISGQRKTHCGNLGDVCGKCDTQCVPKCAGQACGASDSCGGVCAGASATCGEGATCSSHGDCIPNDAHETRDQKVEAKAIGLPGGSFSVSPNGTATYSIPIAVPPAAGGLEPGLALTYDSNDTSMGHIGRGWSLSGISSIGRCARSIRFNGYADGVHFDGTDQFCLDGVPLVAVHGTYGADGTEYRTFVDTFQKVISHGGTPATGPTTFTVKSKDGVTREYGGDDATLIEDGKPRVWKLRHATDRSGQDIAYWYKARSSKGPGDANYTTSENYLQSISYGVQKSSNTKVGHSPNAVRPFWVTFTYEDRPDMFRGYAQGALTERSVRLSSITTSYLDDQVRDYRLNYERFNDGASKLVSVQECGGPADHEGCKAPTTFVYSDVGTKTSADVYKSPSPIEGSKTVPIGARLHVLDANGDGRSDIAYVGANGKWQIALAKDQGLGAPVEVSLSVSVSTWPPSSIGKEDEVAQERAASANGTAVFGVGAPHQHVADYDGDGLDEILEFFESDHSFVRQTFDPSNNTFSSKRTPTGFTTSGVEQTWSFDGDGDGDQDVFVCFKTTGKDDAPRSLYWYRNDGTLFTKVNTSAILDIDCAVSSVLDVNGDGTSEIVLANSRRPPETFEYAQVQRDGTLALKPIKRDGPFGALGYGFAHADRMETLDVNGDLLADLVLWVPNLDAVGRADGKDITLLLLNSGRDGIFTPTKAEQWFKAADIDNHIGFFAVDFDQDGREDVGVFLNDDDGPVRIYRSGLVDKDPLSYQDCSSFEDAKGSCVRNGTDVTCTCGATDDGGDDCEHSGCCNAWQDDCDDKLRQAEEQGATIIHDPNGYSDQCWNNAQCFFPDPDCDEARQLFRCKENNAKLDAAGGAYRTPFIDIPDLWRAVRSGDVNGDGVIDLITVNGDGKVFQHISLVSPRLLSSVSVQPTSDAATATTTTVQYVGPAQATKLGVYSISDDAKCGLLCQNKTSWPLAYIVEEKSRSRDQASTYIYKNGAIDRAYGWLGFSSIIRSLNDVTPSGSKLIFVDETAYSQYVTKTTNVDKLPLYPYAGSPTDQARVWTEEANPLTDANAGIQYRTGVVTVYGTAVSADGRDFIYADTTAGYGKNPEASHVYWTSQTKPDGYGNPDLITTSYPITEGKTSRQVVTDATFSVNDARRASWDVALMDSLVRTETAPDRSPASVTQQTSFVYDGHGRLHIKTVEPNDPAFTVVATYDYDAWGNVNKVTEVDQDSQTQDRVTKTDFGPFGVKPHLVTNAEGHTSTYEYYGAHGALAMQQDANLVVHEWDYDAFGRLLEQRVRESAAVNATVVRTTYDWHQVAVDGTEKGITLPTAFEVTITKSDGSHEFVAFDEAGSGVRRIWDDVQGQGVVRQETALDHFGRVASVQRPHRPGTVGGTDDQGQVSYSYDPLGRVTKVVTPSGTTVQRYLDVEVANSALRSALSSFPEARFLVQSVDANSHETMIAKDGIGRTLWARDAKGGVTTYQYGVHDTVTRIEDAAHNALVVTPDRFGRRSHLNDSDIGSHDFTYYPYGELKTHRDNSVETSFVYDRISRPRSRTTPEGTATWVYDLGTNAKGKLHSYVNADHMRIFSYGAAFGLLDSTTDTVFRPATDIELVTRFDYDGQQRLSNLTYPSGFEIEYGYSPTSEVTSVRNVTENKDIWRATDFYQGYALKAERFQNGVQTTYDYEAGTGLLHSMVGKTANGTSFFADTFGYFANGDVKTVSRLSGVTETYGYDELDRLQTVTYGGTAPVKGVVESYLQDAIGNVTSGPLGTYDYKPIPGEPVFAHKQPHAVRRVGSNSYGYDVHGNQIWREGPDIDGGHEIVGYDALNQLVSIERGTDVPGGTEPAKGFAYDANGQLVIERTGTDTEVVFAGKHYSQRRVNDVVTEETHRVMVGSRVVAEVRGNPASLPLATTFVHADRLGSAAWLSNGQGVPSQGPSYTAFGAPKAPSGLPTEVGYTGHRDLDVSGLVHAGGRVYDSRIGRFLQADPFAENPTSSGGLNRYSYVSNNPLNVVDPSGLFEIVLWGGEACGNGLRACIDKGVASDPDPGVAVYDSEAGESSTPEEGTSGPEVIIDETTGEIEEGGPPPEQPPTTPPPPQAGPTGDGYVEILLISRSVGSPPGEPPRNEHHAEVVVNLGRNGQNEHWILQGGPQGEKGENLRGAAVKVGSEGWYAKATNVQGATWGPEHSKEVRQLPVKVIHQWVIPRNGLTGQALQNIAEQLNTEFKGTPYDYQNGPNSNTWAAGVLDKLGIPYDTQPNDPVMKAFDWKP